MKEECTFRNVVEALKELEVKDLEARINNSGLLEYLWAYGHRGKPIILPPKLERCLENVFRMILVEYLEGDFNDDTGGYGDISLDLEEEVLEASFYFYGQQEYKEVFSLSLEEAAKEVKWRGPIPEKLQTESYVCHNG